MGLAGKSIRRNHTTGRRKSALDGINLDDERLEAKVFSPERAAFAALHKFNRAIFLLDGDGRVTFQNRAATSLVARNDELTLRQDRLQLMCPKSQAALEQFLSDTSESFAESLVLCTQSRLNGCAYRMLVSKLDDSLGYCVFVYTPRGGHQPLSPKLLHRLYGLTPAEANLANELFLGRTLMQAAQSRGISINTAKYTLKSIFTKCEVKSRAELALLLSLGPRTT